MAGYNPLIRVIKTDDYKGKIDFTIEFLGDSGDIPQVAVADVASTSKTPITISAQTLQEGNTGNLFYEAIPGTLILCPLESDQIVVRTNGILAHCPSYNCFYSRQTDNIPSFTNDAWDGEAQSVFITMTNVDSLSASQFSVFLGSYKCQIQSYTDLVLTAKCLEPYSGNFIPSVLIQNLGFADTSSATEVTIDAVLSEVAIVGEPGGINLKGGQVLTVTGFGFGVAGNQGTYVSLTVGGSACNILTLKPSELTCATTGGMSEYCDGENCAFVELVLNSQTGQQSTQTIAKSDTDVSISSLSPSNFYSYNGVMTVSGSNFGSNPGNVFVTDESGSMRYLTILSWQSDSILVHYQSNLGGSSMNLIVQTQYDGNSSPTTITEVTIPSITSINPSDGSPNGGTMISVGVDGILNDYTQMSIYINDPSNPCDIDSLGEGTVFCKTRPMPAGYTTDNQYELILKFRNNIQASCGEICGFTYNLMKYIEISSVTPGPYQPSQVIELVSSTNNLNNEAAVTVTLGDYSLSTFSNTGSSIQAQIPSNVVSAITNWNKK